MIQIPVYDVDLCSVIEAIESSGNPHAIRFESTLYSGSVGPACIDVIASANKCNQATAKMLAYTSFGLYQIMGFNLYEMGLTGDVVSFMTDPVTQDQYFSEFLTQHDINFKLSDMLASSRSMNLFAVKYNGSLKYADTIRRTALRLNLAGAQA